MDVNAPSIEPEPVRDGTLERQPGDFDVSDSGYGGSHGHLDRFEEWEPADLERFMDLGDVVKV